MIDPLARKTISNNFLDRLEKCEKEIRKLKSREIKVRALDDFSDDIGLQTAGEFRSGNGVEPGNGFTGGRFGYPGFEYDGKKWFLVGVNNDELMVGLNLDNGEMIAGGGTVQINDNGIGIVNDAVFEENRVYKFYDANMNYVGGLLCYANSMVEVECVDANSSPDVSLRAKASGGYNAAVGISAQRFNNSIPPAYLNVFLGSDGIGRIEISPGENGCIILGMQNKVTDVTLRGTLSMENTGVVRGGEQIIADDRVYSFTPNTSKGVLIVWSGDDSNPVRGEEWGLIMYYAPTSGTPDIGSMVIGSAYAVRTGTMIGTTGTDGYLSISAANDGKIYIENRRGSSRTVRWNILAGSL